MAMNLTGCAGTLTTKNTKIHEKSQYSFTTEDAEHTEEMQIHFTMKNLARHSRNPKIHLNHEPHEKHEKIQDTKMLSTDDGDGRR